VAGIPELGCGTDDVGFGVLENVVDQWIGSEFGAARVVFFER
jgi:hypothetical protein